MIDRRFVGRLGHQRETENNDEQEGHRAEPQSEADPVPELSGDGVLAFGQGVAVAYHLLKVGHSHAGSGRARHPSCKLVPPRSNLRRKAASEPRSRTGLPAVSELV